MGRGGQMQLGVQGDTDQSPTDRITAILADNQALNLVFYDDEVGDAQGGGTGSHRGRSGFSFADGRTNRSG